MKLKVPKTERRKSVDSKGKRILRNVLIVAAVVVLLALAGTHLFKLIIGNEQLAVPEEAVTSILTPLQSGFASVVDGISNYFYTLKLRSRLELEYNNLRQENEQLVYQAMLVQELQHKLSAYETLFDEIAENELMNPLVATVIGRTSGNYFSVFTINKGSNDGIEDFMAVTMGGALVGYTYNVMPTSSSVRSIIDSEASIAGLISSSRDQGTVRGTFGVDGQAMCRMYYLPEDHLPRPGDLVVTSGVGMSFPKGIPIGTVRESTRGMESNKQYIVVEPSADFEHVEYVIVLRYQPTAEAVEERSSSNDSIAYTPLDTVVPIPTIQIGSDFYQLSPTATPSPEPSIDPDATPSPSPDASAEAAPTPDGGNQNYEYQVPSSMQTDNSYGFTLAPTATPSPTPPPLDLSVEED
ncbi:MAG: rod shape-determining protein MreC [Eubacteriales bacterium]|nr:rod shape-determining protein MreC [Eubacteriales bacterium]